MMDGAIELIRERAQQRTSTDPSHDWLHVLRVESLARRFAAETGADVFVVRAASLLHEVITLPKNHPDSPRAGELCAQAADGILEAAGVARERRDAVAYCIRVHPFSAGIEPVTLEAKILQDADRLDAIGAIGIARCFATCAAMGRPFYDALDPFARGRELDDKAFGLDHFYRKLLRIPETLHTAGAREVAERRVAFLRTFLDQFETEL